ncbi:alpha/beta hydrolase [Streptomyces sp. HNM0575]|uniref:alpha/beta fold hydrolase n=1 Tax=Streptomyces sp. HNM0575 TaxID=2716338 RepID=UPI00145CB924|nr:alpha/beta hydrolase [Streptomyces sp. HNM0575]NLU73389.1 alpha/beta hydrolase [Streptomyces sp. HNM0575]
MPTARLDGIALDYEDHGSGDPVVLVMGTGSYGRSWRLYQVPALVSAGYRVITFDNRGMPPNDSPPGGVSLAAMAEDTGRLIEHLELGPARVVGFSMGVNVVARLLLERPESATQAVLMAGRAQVDPFGAALNRADRDLSDSGIRLPDSYRAMVTAMRHLSPRTLRDPEAVQNWLEVFEFSPQPTGPGVRAQLDLDDHGDLRPEYEKITTPVLCIGFTDDLVVPPEATRRIAEAVPGARYTEIGDCGHYGYLERPTEVNAAMLDFFAGREA